MIAAFKRIDLPVRIVGVMVGLFVLCVLVGIGIGVLVRATLGGFE